MTFLSILIATLGAGIGSVWLAAGLMRIGSLDSASKPSAYVGPRHLLSLAAGALLATAFMHLLPEAFEGGARADKLFAALLGGVVFFFLLDKAELWHHGHEHHHADGQGHDHGHHDHDHNHGQVDMHGGHSHTQLRSGGWAVITGDSVHCFGDGVLIASAFIADPRLGWVAALAVLAHEVPHHIGDLAVMRMSSAGRGAALLKVSLAGAVTALGGAAGYWLVGRLVGGLPYFLVIASSSFIYVALADLVPQLQRRLSARETFAQIAWLLLGIIMVSGAGRFVHAAH